MAPPFSVEAWVAINTGTPHPPSFSLNWWLVEKVVPDVGGAGWGLEYNGVGAPDVYMEFVVEGTTPGPSAGANADTGFTPAETGWHYAAATFDGTVGRVYLDGSLLGVPGTPVAIDSYANAGPLRMGFLHMDESHAPIRICRAALYDGVLSAGTIADHYAASPDVHRVYDDVILATPGIAHYWPLNEVLDTVAHDAITGPSARDGNYLGGYLLAVAGPDGALAVKLDGITGYVEVPFPPPVAIPPGLLVAGTHQAGFIRRGNAA